MQMRSVEAGVPVLAAQGLELKPGGPLHVMLTDLKQPLKAGDSFPLTLTFEKAGLRDVIVKVERLGAMGPTDDVPTNHDAAHHGDGHPAKSSGS